MLWNHYYIEFWGAEHQYLFAKVNFELLRFQRPSYKMAAKFSVFGFYSGKQIFLKYLGALNTNMFYQAWFLMFIAWAVILPDGRRYNFKTPWQATFTLKR